MTTDLAPLHAQGGYGPPGGHVPGGGASGGGFGMPGAPGDWQPPGHPAPPLGGPPGFGSGPPNVELRKQATIWLIVSLFSAGFCGSCCFGLAGAVFCFLAMQAADQGNLDDAEAKLKWGKIITVSGIVLGVVMGFVLLLVRFAGALLN